MKTFLLLVAVIATATVYAVPHGRDPEYAMVPDTDGTFKLINIHEDAEPENFFDASSDVNFLLFTRSNPLEPQILGLGDRDSILDSNFNPEHPTRILIHGWNGGADSAINTLCTANYLQRGDFNVIVVDWAAGAVTNNYLTARNRVGAVGAVTSLLVTKLHNVKDIQPREICVIGHSLGAHVAGFVGKNFVGDWQFGYIVALDAAFPLFSIDEPTQRVDIGDAFYVESIHTNVGQLGFDEPLGDASFYPNFGTRQPGCGIDITGSCAHGRAVEYFAESIITDRHFWSRQCERYKDILMESCTASGLDRKMGGEPVDTDARGIYWTSTNNASPFATGIV